MGRALEHRGPDDAGEHVWRPEPGRRPSVGFAFRRLAILDLGLRPHQPCLSRDGSHALVFNGEIYGYVELREELELLGSGSLRAAIPRCCSAPATWGDDALPRLRGRSHTRVA